MASEHWFRSHHGAPTDPKWIVVARRVGTEPGVVAATWWALMDHASQNTPRGSADGFDSESVAAFFGWEDTVVAAVLAVLREKGLVGADGMLAAWEKRQPKREDDSSPRVRKFRERQRTQAPKPASIPETIPAVTTVPVTHGNAVKRDVTLEERRGEKRREEETPYGSSNGATSPVPDGFDLFWESYPKRAGTAGKGEAAKRWRARLREKYEATVMTEAATRYGRWCLATGKVGTEKVLRASTFLGDPNNFTNEWKPAEPAANGKAPAADETPDAKKLREETADRLRYEKDHPAEAKKLWSAALDQAAFRHMDGKEANSFARGLYRAAIARQLAQPVLVVAAGGAA